MSVENNVEIVNAGTKSNPFPVEVSSAPAPKKAPKPKPAAKKVPTPKPAAPVAKATPAPKGKKSVAEKKEEAAASAPATKEKKAGLRKPQVRILAWLSKAGKPQTRAQIAEKAPCDVANCVELLGSHNPETRAANDVKHYPSLLSLGFVKLEKHDVDGKDVMSYSISAKGKAAYEKLNK